MKRLILILLLATPLAAATTRNDDSCDIGLYPAATLLLPYFEVDITTHGRGETTIVTITNVSSVPQAARVTLWTDYAYPVLSFNLHLTGYDVQSVNLFDVVAHGILPGGPAENGELSRAGNARLSEDTCATIPTQLPPALLLRLQSALIVGRVPECDKAGSRGLTHPNAVGYATIDVVGACTGTLPVDPGYFTHEIRFDNVLAGDYAQVNGHEDFARANPLVHIRAIPEGGEASTRRKSNLPRTFYGRLQRGPDAALDARQPLPATFAARWIERGATGFETYFKVWREARTSAATLCSAYPAANAMPYEVIRFDEDENPEIFRPVQTGGPPIVNISHLPAASRMPTTDESQFPPNSTGSPGGWMYFNFHNDAPGTIASQNWVVVSLVAADRHSIDADAVALGNGCTPAVPKYTAFAGIRPIGPAPNVHP